MWKTTIDVFLVLSCVVGIVCLFLFLVAFTHLLWHKKRAKIFEKERKCPDFVEVKEVPPLFTELGINPEELFENGPLSDSELEALCQLAFNKGNNGTIKFLQKFEDLKTSIADLRLAIKYQRFDIEVTKREMNCGN